MSRPAEKRASGSRRLASVAVVTTVVLVLVATAAATGVTAVPTTGGSSAAAGAGSSAVATDGQAAGVPAVRKADNGTAGDAGSADVTDRDHAIPSRERRAKQRAAALAATDGNPTVAALREGSFAFARHVRYGPDGGSVEVATWHERRVAGDWRTGIEVTYEAGYRATVDVGPDGGVQALALSAREPTTVTLSYDDAQKRAIATALDDAAVASALAGDDYYVSRAAPAGSLGVGACADAACHVVTFQRVESAAVLHVKVAAKAGVVGVERADWDAVPASPAVDASAHPAVAGEDGVADEGGVGATASSPVQANNWTVYFTSTSGDGLQVGSAYHDGTQFLYQAQVPNVRLYYPDGTSFRQNLTSADLANGVQLTNYSTGFRLYGNYYAGCTEAAWPVDGCNRYTVEWTFDEWGGFDPWVQVHGPGSSGLGGEPHYRVRWHFDTDIDGFSSDTVAEWLGSRWDNFTYETTFDSADPKDPAGNELQVLDVHDGYRANLSAYGPDDADFYALRYQPAVEWSPANFIDGENVYDNDTMAYYVASRTDCNPNTICTPGGVWTVDS